MSSKSPFEHLYSRYDIQRKHDDPDSSRDKYPPDWNYRQAAMMNYHNERCARCRRRIGSGSDVHQFNVHHIIPLSQRGTHHLDNLTPLCADCHGLMHPDNDRLNDWRNAPMFPAESADRRVAVERVPLNERERAVYDDRSSPEDFDADGDVNSYSLSKATTSVPAKVAVQKDPPKNGESLGRDGQLELFCNQCNRLVEDGSATCESCTSGATSGVLENKKVAVGVGIGVAIVLALLVLAVV